jgi:two-component system, LytTR family, sensor kinase
MRISSGSFGAWLLGLFAAWTGVVALSTVQSMLAIQAVGGPLAWRLLLPPRLLDLALGVLFLPLLLWLVRRPSHLLVVLGATAAFALLRALAGPPLEHALLGPVVFHGSRVAKGIGDFLSLAVLAGGVYALELRRRLARRERQALQLEASLSEARLDALASQLRPHFLFNTLNAVSVLMHRDPRAADLMLTRLADLLRATLQAPAAHEIPLADEAALLGRYLEIMRVRHGPRLAVHEAFPAELANALVPPFVLQPLVENALEHGIARRAGAGCVEIAAGAVDGRLRLTVTDDGPGLGAPGRWSEGVGLSTTRRRLEQLYGAAGTLALEPAEGGGTRATVEFPLRRRAQVPA